jgi:hypothetical protein
LPITRVMSTISPSSQRRRALVVTALVGLALSVAFVAGGCSGDEAARPGCDGFPFDSAACRAETSNSGAPGALTERQRMADNLVACESLLGTSRTDVRRVLGAADVKGEDGDWYFDLGPDRDAGLDREQLEVKFDERGRVTKTELATF